MSKITPLYQQYRIYLIRARLARAYDKGDEKRMLRLSRVMDGYQKALYDQASQERKSG